MDSLTIPLWDCPELKAITGYSLTVEDQRTKERRVVRWADREPLRWLEWDDDEAYWKDLGPDEIVVAWMFAPEIPVYTGPAQEAT